MSQLNSQTIRTFRHAAEHFEASSKQVGQNSVDELWPKRHCRVLRVQDDPRSKVKTENTTAAKRLAIAMSISTMPTTGFTTT